MINLCYLPLIPTVLLIYNSLQAAKAVIDPVRFFRINRSELVQTQYIERLERYCKNTLTLYLQGGVQLKTSQGRTSDFNRWLGVVVKTASSSPAL